MRHLRSCFPALTDRIFHILGLLENTNQRNKLFLRERVVVESDCRKVRADFLFLGAALKMDGFCKLLLHGGNGQLIISRQSIGFMSLTNV